MIASDENVQQYLADVERLLHVVCDDDEFPWFVSDEATIFDVTTLSEAEIAERIAAILGTVVTAADLKLPLWQLAARMRPLSG